MPNYTKLFNSLVTSTIWAEDDQTRIVWITMLALADKNGEVHASLPGLARVAGVSLEQTQQAIAKFLSPDRYSRTPDDDGRRIEVIDGGWMLLNHAKYRALASKDEQKSSNAIRQQRFRAKKARNATGHNDEDCAYCGKQAAGVDHVIPKSKGGSDASHNLVRCCKRCNSHKASRDLVDFLNDLTLPFSLSPESILASPVLNRHVTLSNGIWSAVTQDRDIAEADTEAEADPLKKKTVASAPSRFCKPSVQEVAAYGMTLTPQFCKAAEFVDFYDSKGWKVGNTPMKDWKAAVRTWHRKDAPSATGKTYSHANGYNESTDISHL